MIFSVFNYVAVISFGVLIGFYLTYFVLLRYNQPFKKNLSKTWKMASETITPPTAFPTVSLIVPVYNESGIINKKIDNLEETTYPSDRIEIIFVDGHSTDKTCNIIKERTKTSKKPMRLIAQQKRDGYTGAVVQGISNAQGEIIIATDAASYYLPDTLLCLVRHFADPKIGAVTGKEIVLGDSNSAGPRLEKSYRSFYDFMRKAETHIDSTPDSKGEILAIRTQICRELVPKLSFSPNASFDSCVPYQAKLMGYRTIYDEHAKYYEYAPSSASDRFTQQARRGTLLIGALLLFKNMIFKKEFGKFGTLILPIHFIMVCLLPSIFLVGTVTLVMATAFNPFPLLILWAALLVLISASTKFRLTLFAFIQSQFALILALFRLARRHKSLYITSIPSTRNVHSN